MAEAIAFNTASSVVMKLGSLAVKEIGLLWGVNNELQKLKSTVSIIKAVLLDAEAQYEKNHEVREWLGRLKQVVYDADDVLDDFVVFALKRKVMDTNKRMRRKVRIFFSRSNKLVVNIKVVRKIKSIRERLGAIAEDRMQFQFKDCPVEPLVLAGTAREETHSFVSAEKVIGRGEDKRAIVEILLRSNGPENVSIIPLVGIGGLGKTTLAQLVYNDEKVQTHFELKMWVCVSNVFDVKLVAETIIESATGRRPERNLSMDQVQDQLRNEIHGKRYLLVLDDVWNEDRERWLKLRDLLIGGTRESKILVTTRTQLVARIMGTVDPYLLKGLSENESWSLFKKMAFKQGQETENPHLVAIGKEIAAKCAGVPLAIRSLGSLLYYKDTESEWLYLKNNELPKIAREENIILPILRLSYDNLPSHLKQCFAYCSMFPKDHDIDKQTLIRLWMALGFVQLSDEIQHEEDIGDQYFTDLLRRSFFQDVVKNEWGNVTSCRMHDLIHDLAQSVAGNEISLVNLAEETVKDVGKRTRHVSFYSTPSIVCRIPTPFCNENKIRSFLLTAQTWYGARVDVYDAVVSSLEWLRALDFHYFGLPRVPSSIGRLRHLKYLDLSGNEFMLLPESICRLQNLQTLNLSHCYKLKELPTGIKYLVSLRHLDLDGCTKLTHMPHGLGQLTYLRTLTLFVVGKDIPISGLIGGLTELNGLINLRGELTIRILGVGHLRSAPNKATLSRKEFVHSLKLQWDGDGVGGEGDDPLFEVLRPHPNLKKLSVGGYEGEKFPSWLMVNAGVLLPNLVAITIDGCSKCQHLPPFWQLPSLQILSVSSLTSVEYIDNCSDNESSFPSLSRTNGGSTTFFPSLIKLNLFHLPFLKAWWNREFVPPLSSVPSFPSLFKSTIEYCPRLMSMAGSECLENLRLNRVSQKLVHQQLMMESTTGYCPLSRMKALYIDCINDLVTLPEEGLRNLTSLEHLEISCCNNLMSLPMGGLRGLTSLKVLMIRSCARLASLSGGVRHLTSLENLVIINCGKLDLLANDDGEQGMQFRYLGSLASLSLSDVPKLVSFPVGLQHATSLQSIRVDNCHSLETTLEWIGNLTSLQDLSLHHCPKLRLLPDGMHRLTALQQLIISECPYLYARCEREIGEDWPKIAHIPYVNCTY